jgi:WD40 repeat protein
MFRNSFSDCYIKYLVLLLHCLLTDTKELVATLSGHESAVHHISVHGSGRYVLTSSNDTSLLWDVTTFQRKRKLNIRENVGILQVRFHWSLSYNYFRR